MHKCIRGIRYNAGQFLDLYLTEEPRAPLVVGIHGGGFFSGSREDERCQQMGTFLREEGINFAAISYALAPRENRFAKWPETICDVADAIKYLSENGDRWGFDPGRLGMIGFSAGCCLATLYMLGGSNLYRYLGYETPITVPKALVGFYGPYDFSQREKGKQPRDPEVNKIHSPAHWFGQWKGKEAPPVFLLHGTEDSTVLLKQHELFKVDYLSQRFSFSEKVLTGFHHSFAPCAEAEGQQPVDLRPEILDFYRQHL